MPRRGFKHGFPDRPDLAIRTPMMIHRSQWGSAVDPSTDLGTGPPPANEADHGFGIWESQDRVACGPWAKINKWAKAPINTIRFPTCDTPCHIPNCRAKTVRSSDAVPAAYRWRFNSTNFGCSQKPPTQTRANIAISPQREARAHRPPPPDRHCNTRAKTAQTHCSTKYLANTDCAMSPAFCRPTKSVTAGEKKFGPTTAVRNNPAPNHTAAFTTATTCQRIRMGGDFSETPPKTNRQSGANRAASFRGGAAAGVARHPWLP